MNRKRARFLLMTVYLRLALIPNIVHLDQKTTAFQPQATPVFLCPAAVVFHTSVS